LSNRRRVDTQKILPLMENKTQITILALTAAVILTLGHPLLAPNEKIVNPYRPTDQTSLPPQTPTPNKSEAPQSKYSCPNCNVILISIDMLRADHVGVYGYYKNTTPNLDRLANSGIFFKNTYSTAPWTLPSHASMFTGLYPMTHQARNPTSMLNVTIPTIASTLKAQGYTTAAFVGGGYLDKRFGLWNGFDTYVVEWVNYSLPKEEISGKNVFRKAESLLGENRGKFFLFLHTYQVHDYGNLQDDTFINKTLSDRYSEEINSGKILYLPTTFFASNATLQDKEQLTYLEGRYDSAIFDVDGQIKEFIDYLGWKGILNSTLIIITSDHGEAFAEHGYGSHSNTLYEELLKVPLIILTPGYTPPQSAINATVSLVDLFPTIIKSVSGQKLTCEGVDILGDMDDDGRDIYSDTTTTNKYSLTQNGKKIIRTDVLGAINPRLTGFYLPEYTVKSNISFSWTMNVSSINLSGFGKKNLSIILGVRLYSPLKPNISFSYNGKIVDFQVARGWTVDNYMLLLPADTSGGDDIIYMTAKAWSPKVFWASEDDRLLGIAVDWIRVSDADQPENPPLLDTDFALDEKTISYELYDLQKDPKEQNNLIGAVGNDISVQENIKQLDNYDDAREKKPTTQTVSELLHSQLRALGYV
jgi:hypothetical protein